MVFFRITWRKLSKWEVRREYVDKHQLVSSFQPASFIDPQLDCHDSLAFRCDSLTSRDAQSFTPIPAWS